MCRNVYTFCLYPLPQSYMNTMSKLYWHFKNGATLPLLFQLFILHTDVLQKILLQNTMGEPNLTDTLFKNELILEYLTICVILILSLNDNHSATVVL
jgi:hypothetical protein